MASLPGLNWIQAGNIRIWPTLIVGYKKIAFNFNLNIPPTQVLSPFVIFPNYGSLLDTFPLDTRRSSLPIWRLAHSVLMRSLRRLAACSAVFPANIPRTVGIEASQGPGIGVTLNQKRGVGRDHGFNGPNMSSVGGTTSIRPLGLVAGIRFDRISVRFSDPEPVPEL